MSFDVSPAAYLRFMGPYSEPLAARFADLAGASYGQRVLDVGCGPGVLTAELVRRAGAESVSAVEPSAPFAAAVRERLPAGAYVASLAPGRRAELREHCRRLLPAGPGEVTAVAWAACGRA